MLWKERLLEFHQRLLRWEPDQNSAWVRFIRISRLAGLKEAVKPGVHYLKRLFLLAAFVGCLSYGIVLMSAALVRYFQRPILHTFHDGGVPIERAVFPGLTVSSPYMLRKKTLDDALEIYIELENANGTAVVVKGVEWSTSEASKLIHTIDHICDSSKSYGKAFGTLREGKSYDLQRYIEWVEEENVTLVDSMKDTVFKEKVFPFVKKGLTNCFEIITGCLWRGSQNLSCNELFSSVQTDVGVGCSFNKIPDHILRNDTGLKTILYERERPFEDENELWTAWDIDKHPFLESENDDIKSETRRSKNIPYRQKVSGKDKGFSFTLKYDKSNSDVACPIFDSVGKMISFHSPIDEPRVLTQGINIPPGKEVFIRLFPEVTIADPRIRNLDIKQRKCYFQDETPLKIYKKYTQGNCLKECLAKRIQKACNCLQLSMTAGKNEKICGPLQQECVQREIEEIDSIGYGEACREPRCYAPCTEITYKTEVTSSKLIIDHPETLGVGSSATRLSVVHVYMTSESIVSHERTLNLDYSEFFGIFGGIISLTNGIDILQMFHILAGFFVLVGSLLESLYRLGQIFGRKLRVIFNFNNGNESHSLPPAPQNPSGSDAGVEFIMVRPREESGQDLNP